MTKRILYLGLDPQYYLPEEEAEIVHWPIIQILPRPLSDSSLQATLLEFPLYSHVIMTSKSTVKILSLYLSQLGIPLKNWQDKITLAIGKATAAALVKEGIKPARIAQEETAEGMVGELEKLILKDAYLFWPHSSQAREVIKHFFITKQLCHRTCILYDPVPCLKQPTLSLEDFNAIVFTSPSTVEAFFQLFKTIPVPLKLIPIGPITAQYLNLIYPDRA